MTKNQSWTVFDELKFLQVTAARITQDPRRLDGCTEMEYDDLLLTKRRFANPASFLRNYASGLRYSHAWTLAQRRIIENQIEALLE